MDYPVDRAIEMYNYQPSIILINKKVDNQNKFCFKYIVKGIKDINPNK